MPKCRKSVNFGLQLGPRGGKPHLPFGIIFVHGAPLGARMGPRPLPRASGTPPDLNFKRILVDFHRFFNNFGWFSAGFFHRFSMVELGWERVPYSTGWEGAVANLGGNTSRKTWVGRVPTQVCRRTFLPNLWRTCSHPSLLAHLPTQLLEV